jgi:preprotein translocase subunit YajC
MLITKAHATSDIEVPSAPSTTTSTGTPDVIPAVEAPGMAEAFMTNMMMVLVLVILFYLLLIKPQQRRFREHSQMLNQLKKGDKVVTAGGLIGTIDKMSDADEVVIDLGNGIKVTALRSTIQGKDDPRMRKSAANDQKAKEEKKS